jgi:hypothetical protein
MDSECGCDNTEKRKQMEALIIAAMIAAMIRFLHYCIGSPSIDTETGNPVTHKGRIFSIYGRFISSRYILFENKEDARTRSNFNAWQQKRIIEHEREMESASPLEQHNLIEQLQKDIEKTKADFESRRKPNPWMAAGMCPICFGTWVSLVLWLFVPIMFGIEPGFVIFGIPTSVIISNRLKI